MKLSPEMTKKEFWKEITREVMGVFKKNPELKKLVSKKEAKRDLKKAEGK